MTQLNIGQPSQKPDGLMVNLPSSSMSQLDDIANHAAVSGRRGKPLMPLTRHAGDMERFAQDIGFREGVFMRGLPRRQNAVA